MVRRATGWTRDPAWRALPRLPAPSLLPPGPLGGGPWRRDDESLGCLPVGADGEDRRHPRRRRPRHRLPVLLRAPAGGLSADPPRPQPGRLAGGAAAHCRRPELFCQGRHHSDPGREAGLSLRSGADHRAGAGGLLGHPVRPSDDALRPATPTHRAYVTDINISVLFVLGVSSFGIYGIILGGWA